MDKRILKNINILMLLISLCCIIMSIFAYCTAQNSIQFVVQAQEVEESDITNESLQEMIIAIENELHEQGESIVTVLQSQKVFYEEEFNIVKVEDQGTVTAKINTVDQAIEEVSSYMDFLSNDSNESLTRSSDGSPYSFYVSPNCTCGTIEIALGTPCDDCKLYKNMDIFISAIKSFFWFRGYWLAADLLCFNRTNTTLDIEYWPTLGTRLAQVSQITNDLAQNNTLVDGCNNLYNPGLLDFSPEGTLAADVYYSLGSFWYSKTLANNGMINFLIQDRYDWEPKEENVEEENIDFIEKVINDTFGVMTTAQELGILTPFYTKIYLTIPGYVPYDWAYTDDGVGIYGVANDITEVNIPEKVYDIRERKENLSEVAVTTIGLNAFANQTQITSVTLPDTITSIGDNAFAGCTNLTSINFPNSLKEIRAMAFNGCTSLSSVTLPEGLLQIRVGAFSSCPNLTNINIPSSVTYIGYSAFEGCNNLTITVHTSNLNFKSENNIIYNKAGTKIIATGEISSAVTIPSTVTEIENYAFSENTNLEKLHIYGTPSFGLCAFANCENLEEVYIYSYTMLDIDAFVFENSAVTVYVPYNKQGAYSTIFTEPLQSVTSIPIQVTLMLNESELYQIINTYYGATIFGIEDPYQEGNTFIGWKNGDVIYNNGDTWNVTTNITVIAEFDENEPETFEYIVQLDKQCEQDADYITVTLGQPMPTAEKPHRTGYSFWGYFTQVNGRGVRYYDDNMNSLRNWDIESNNVTLYAYWERENYEVVLSWGYNLNSETVYVHYGDEIVPRETPTRPHYKFAGYYSEANGRGNCYATGEVVQENGQYVMKAVSTGLKWNYESGGTLYAYWRFIMVSVPWQAINTSDNSVIGTGSVIVESGVEMDITAPTYNGKDFVGWEICGVTYSTQVITVTLELHLSPLTGEYVLCTSSGADGEMKILYQNSCVAAGTLITLADGSQVPVETLTGNEMLLVWNLHTGSFDTAPILFIDSDEAREYQIINLYFSDGTHVKVISEHGFWDFDLNRYVYLDANAGQYVGHWFNKQVTDEDGNFAWGRVQLINVTLTKEYTTAWSPVTYGHLCLYVNGMLSMPGATGGLVNTFEVDGTTMRIDEQSYLEDIATYGLYTYEEFAQEYDVPEEIFNAVQGQYLKVAIGKGLIDAQGINALINSYSQFF